MTEKNKATVKEATPAEKTLGDLSEMELKSLAFDIDQQIKQKQREYNVVMQVLNEKTKKEQ